MKIALGDWLEVPEESIAGTVTELWQDDEGEFLSAVVAMDDGTYAAVDLTLLERQTVTLH